MAEILQPDNNALTMIGLRQIFYIRQLRLIVIALVLNLVLNGILVGIINYFIKRPVQPIYFAVNNSGKLIVDTPINMANMPNDSVALWAKTAIEAAYSYDFVNYRAQLQKAQNYFNDYGWQRYTKSLKESNNLLALTNRKMLVSAKVVSAPVLLKTGLLQQRYAWKFSLPVLVTYSYPPYDNNSQFANPLNVSVLIMRRSLAESDDGLGITQVLSDLVDTSSG